MELILDSAVIEEVEEIASWEIPRGLGSYEIRRESLTIPLR